MLIHREVGDSYIYHIPNLSIIWIWNIFYSINTSESRRKIPLPMENPMESSACQTGNVSEELSCFETLEGTDKLLGNSDFDQWSLYFISTSFSNSCTWPFFNLDSVANLLFPFPRDHHGEHLPGSPAGWVVWKLRKCWCRPQLCGESDQGTLCDPGYEVNPNENARLKTSFWVILCLKLFTGRHISR